MTIEKINVSEDELKWAFHSRERSYLQTLTAMANRISALMKLGQATMEEKLQYHSLKWALKELGAIGKDNLEKINDQ